MLSQPEKDALERRVQKEAEGFQRTRADAQQQVRARNLEALATPDPKLKATADAARVELSNLQHAPDFVAILQNREHPDYAAVKARYDTLCEQATADLPSDPEQASLAKILRSGPLEERRPIGEQGRRR
jgi:hypothetical protein